MVRLSSLLTLVLSFTLEGWAAWDTNRSLTYICKTLCGVDSEDRDGLVYTFEIYVVWMLKVNRT